MTRQAIMNKIHKGLIVSCQALDEEPLHSSYIMSRMAYAAKLGGAVGIRANTVADIQAIRTVVELPIIGIIKRRYEGSDVVISPTRKEIDALVQEQVEIIAMDATDRVRPDGVTICELFSTIRKDYPDQLFMADCASYEDAIKAFELGFDLVGTTLNGYTKEARQTPPPNFELMRKLVETLNCPIIAEGGICSPEQLRQAMDQGVFACVVGSAITRPLEITRRFVAALQ